MCTYEQQQPHIHTHTYTSARIELQSIIHEISKCRLCMMCSFNMYILQHKNISVYCLISIYMI